MADCPRAEPHAWLGVRTYRSAAGPAGDFGGDEGPKQLRSGECVPSASLPRRGSRMHPPGAGKVAVACVAVRDALGDTASQPGFVGAGGPALCPAAPERLGFILMCICTRSQCEWHWDPHAGHAVPSQQEWGWLLWSVKVWGMGRWFLSQLCNVCLCGGFFHKGKTNLGQLAQIANWLKGEGRKKTNSAGHPGANSHGFK